MSCPICGGNLEEGAPNEYGFQCDTCPHPYDELEDKQEEGEKK